MSSQETATLSCPVGQHELELIRNCGFRAFPSRLPHQPIFYPVLNEQYAIQIARDWNTRDAASGYAGCVTRFRVRADFLDRYPVHRVGGAAHQEYRIPAEDLADPNAIVVGQIEIVAEFLAAAP